MPYHHSYTHRVAIGLARQPPWDEETLSKLESIYEELRGQSFPGRYTGVAEIQTTLRWKIQVDDDWVKAKLEKMDACIEEIKNKYQSKIWTGFVVDKGSIELYIRGSDFEPRNHNAITGTAEMNTFTITKLNIFPFTMSDQGYDYGADISLKFEPINSFIRSS